MTENMKGHEKRRKQVNNISFLKKSKSNKNLASRLKDTIMLVAVKTGKQQEKK